MKKYIEALRGISYCEWVKLREGIDSEFDRQIGESKRSLQLTDSENVKKLSVHDLDVNWINSPIVALITNMNII